jgi:hypothetical protein
MKTEYQKQKQRDKRRIKSEKMLSIWEEKTQELENFLNENELRDNAEQLSPYHFRLTTNKVTIDIWAGVKKFYIKGMSGSARYDNLNELKSYL